MLYVILLFVILQIFYSDLTFTALSSLYRGGPGPLIEGPGPLIEGPGPLIEGPGPLITNPNPLTRDHN